MSKRRNGCTGKVRHRTKIGAVIAMRKMNNAGLGTYPCPLCHGWHVGTSRSEYKVQKRLDQLLKKEEV